MKHGNERRSLVITGVLDRQILPPSYYLRDARGFVASERGREEFGPKNYYLESLTGNGLFRDILSTFPLGSNVELRISIWKKRGHRLVVKHSLKLVARPK